ncbi:MAG: hypothetical protein U0R52_06550 [Solirubrobacterales bacterium]
MGIWVIGARADPTCDAADPQIAGTTIYGTNCPEVIAAPQGVTDIESGGGDDIVVGNGEPITISAGTGDDVIYAAGATEVDAGRGADLIYGDSAPPVGTEAALAADSAARKAPVRLKRHSHHGAGATASQDCPSNQNSQQYCGDDNATYDGTSGQDVIFGERGNDTLRGGDGNDLLFGGIGDDHLFGQNDDDFLAGGMGGDEMNGGPGSDTARGDGTVDSPVFDSGTGTGDLDTLSFATGVTPGFPSHNWAAESVPDPNSYTGFPGSSGERGVYVNLQNSIADNGVAIDGGGLDSVTAGNFERIVGTAFSDYLIGTSSAQTIYGGGGADIIQGRGGGDTIFGGSDGDNIDGGGGATIDGGPGVDYCVGGSSQPSCNESGASATAVKPRNAGQVSIGMMQPGGTPYHGFYAIGSAQNEWISATYDQGANQVKVMVPLGTVDTSEGAKTPPCDYTHAADQVRYVTCPFTARLDTMLLAGMSGADYLNAGDRANGDFPTSSTVIILGGNDPDELLGGNKDEATLVDGPDGASDILHGYGRDDLLSTHGGADSLRGGNDSDLLLSSAVCQSDTLNGFGDSQTSDGNNNASWAKMPASSGGVGAKLTGGDGTAGHPASGPPECNVGEPGLDSLVNFKALEGSGQDDRLVGDANDNILIGHSGSDSIFAGDGNDSLTTNAGDDETTLDCGNGSDKEGIDYSDSSHPPYSPYNDRSRLQAAGNCDLNSPGYGATELPPGG